MMRIYGYVGLVGKESGKGMAGDGFLSVTKRAPGPESSATHANSNTPEVIFGKNDVGERATSGHSSF